MKFSIRVTQLVLSSCLLAWLAIGCGPVAEHGHPPGTHGGIIVPLGEDHYHVEALFTDGGELRLYTLAQDELQVIDVESQPLKVYLRQAGDTVSKEMTLQPTPQPGDKEGRTSLFAGALPTDLKAGLIEVIVPTIRINEQRYRFSFNTTDPIMPRKITDEAERDLYLTPQGLYTNEDIAANGSVTASEKYRGFLSAHDSHPQAGDRICPVTSTKANASCTWIIDGQEYQFCCPPCIDEFLKQAKETPDSIKAPTAYTMP